MADAFTAAVRRLGLAAPLGLAVFLLACGGAGQGSTETSPAPPPPTPQPDFSLSFSDASIPIQQQGEQQGQGITITSVNGFSGTATVSFTLPSGLSVSPLGPFAVAAGQTQSFMVAASTAAAVGTDTILVTATSGSITHSKSFSVDVSAAAPFYLTASPPSLSLAPATTTNIVITLVNSSTTQSNIVLTLQNTSSNLQDTGVNIPGQFTVVGANQFQFQVQSTLAAQPVQNFPIVFMAGDNAGNTRSGLINVSRE